MDINEFVKGMNDPKLKEAISNLGNTPQGQNLLKNLTPEDKKNLMDKLGKLSSNGITKDMLLHQLKNPDVISKLGSILNKKG